MKLLVKGKNVQVSSRVQAYAEKRLGKLSKMLDDDLTRLEIELCEIKNPSVADSHIAEATIWTKGPTLRARESSPDFLQSIDLVAEKLQRQVTRFRDKQKQYKLGGPHHIGGRHSGNGHGRYKSALRDNGNGSGALPPEYEFTTSQLEERMAQQEVVRIVKTKQFRLGPMSPEEAAEQLELINHDFYVFVNADNNQTCVLYRRADGDYGLIEPTLTEAEAS